MQSIYNQLIYFAFLQSILLLMIYLFSAKKRKQVNGYLIFLVIAILLGLAGKILHLNGFLGKNFRLILISELAGLLFGTTLYLFTQTSLLGKKPRIIDVVHYLPAFFYTLSILFYFILPADEIQRQRVNSGETNRVVYLFHAIVLLVNTAYWGMSFRELLRFRNELKKELSFSVKDSFFFNFHLVIGFCLLVWGTVYIISLFGPVLIEREFRIVIWLILSLIVLFITYYSMISNEIYLLKPLEIVKKYNKSKFSNQDLDNLKELLDNLMQEKKPYLNNKLLKAELAEMLEISNPELARLLNERIGMNFFEYVNSFRIKEFIEVANIKKNELTLFGIAQEVGFNSKTTFIKSFKNLTGLTPSQYFDS